MNLSKTFTSSGRDYRCLYSKNDPEYAFQVVVEETDLWVVCEQDLEAQVRDKVHALRAELKNYIVLNPHFKDAMSPLAVGDSASALVRSMAAAAQKIGVGPMAAVAGAIAHSIADDLCAQSPNILIENGGDIYIHSTRSRKIGILSDPDSGIKLGFILKKQDFPCALCASSATIGHSVSLGQGELVVVKSFSGALADAAATMLCNMLRSRLDLRKVLKKAEQMQDIGIQGVLAQCQGELGAWGNMELTTV